MEHEKVLKLLKRVNNLLVKMLPKDGERSPLIEHHIRQINDIHLDHFSLAVTERAQEKHNKGLDKK